MLNYIAIYKIEYKCEIDDIYLFNDLPSTHFTIHIILKYFKIFHTNKGNTISIAI